MYTTLLPIITMLTTLLPTTLSHPSLTPRNGVKGGELAALIINLYPDQGGCHGQMKPYNEIKYGDNITQVALSYSLNCDLQQAEALDFYANNVKFMMTEVAKRRGCHTLPVKMEAMNLWMPKYPGPGQGSMGMGGV